MHEKYLAYLLDKAKLSSPEDVPIHALIVSGDDVIAESGNHREQKKTPLGHAEIDVIMQACQKKNSWRLLDTTLYVLIEPCLMCTGTIYAARIPQVVFGVTNPKGGALIHAQENRKKLGLNHSVELVYGYYEEEIKSMLSAFFSEKRS
ncbi:MAG: nucleoside deaminase [Deltaproteobacteria bacterium]|nr:nucleoside deaminase [Deltaproteobacteria bacterium]